MAQYRYYHSCRQFMEFIIIIISLLPKMCDAVWTLTGSSEFAATNESFLLTCNPNVNVVAINWRRSGTIIASIDYTNRCVIQNGSDTQYQYTCEPGPVYNLTIPANVMTNSQNNIVWRCESPFGGVGNSTQYTLKFSVPVSSVNIQGDSGYPAANVTYENIPKTFTCKTNGCRPKANVTVTTKGVTEGQRTEIQGTQSDGLIVTTVNQTITATRGGSLKTIECSAVNIQGRQPVTSKTLTLDVYYTPIITLDTTTITVQEGDNPSRQCAAIGNPTPTVKWYRGSSEQTSGTGTSATLVFTNIDRNQADTYHCKATATGNLNFESSKSLPVVVFYPPAVTVNLQNTTENATNVVFTCNAADGFPTNYTYHGWNQYIGNTFVRSYTDFTGMLSESNRKLTIHKVTFDNIGRYHCFVENGFHGRKQDVLQQGSSFLDVRASAKFDPKEEARKPGELHKNLTINITFYSNPPTVKSDITWINKTSENSLTNSDSISLNLINTAIQRNVNGKSVTFNGQSAILIITSLQSFHLGNYELQIQNGGNLSASFVFQIITSEPPEAPSEFKLKGNGTKSVKLTWKRGFNGGHIQTFVIRYTNTFTRETKETTIEETNHNSTYTIEIDELEPSTTYHFWIYSTNEKGNSTLSDNLIVHTIKELEPESRNIGAFVGGVTGTLAAVIIVVVIAGVIIHRWRTHETKRNDSRQNDKFPLTARDQSNEEGGAKSKKLLGKTKEKKTKPANSVAEDGTLYENMDDVNSQKKGDERKKPKGPKTKTKPNKNNDGLIYVDILQENNSNGENRLVIHGLENKTDYAEVDFSRSGKPLPPDNSQTNKQEPTNK